MVLCLVLTVSKCSFQIFSLSLRSFVGFPFLSLTTVLVLFFLPVRVFTIRCSSPALPFSAALSAISAISFIQYLLSSRALRLTSWSFPLYCSFILFLTLSERVLSNFSFSCLLSFTFFHVPSRNQGLLVFLAMASTSLAAPTYIWLHSVVHVVSIFFLQICQGF